MPLLLPPHRRSGLLRLRRAAYLGKVKSILPVVLAALGATVAVVLVVALELGATGPAFCVPEAGGMMPICRPRPPSSWALVLAPLTGGLLAGSLTLAVLGRRKVSDRR